MNAVAALAQASEAAEQWSTVALGDIVEVLDRLRKPITKRDRAAGPYPYYGATGVLDWVHGHLFDEPLILVGEDGAKWGAGESSAFSISGKTWVNNHAHVLRPVRKRVLDKWLIYFLNAADLSSFVSGLTVPKLNQGQLREIPIPLPPLEEQKRIIAVLDKAFAALDRVRANAKANLADAAELLASALREKFDRASTGNARLSFDQLCDTITPKVKIQRKEYLDEGAYPIVSQEAESVSGYWNDPGALLGIERPVVVFGDHTRCLKYIDFDFVVGADGTKIMQPKPGISAGYLYFGLRSQPVPEGGYARHFKFVRELTLPDIPFREQEDLARELFGLEGKCAELEGAYRAKLTDIAALRQSLLQKAFAGQLS